MTTRDRSSSSASDHERLDAMRQEWEVPPGKPCCGDFRKDDYGDDRCRTCGWSELTHEMLFLLDRLAALEHERDELQAAWTEAREIAERSIRKRQEAEAALLSLQAAVREKIAMFEKYRDAPMNGGSQAEVRGIRKTLNVVVTELQAALLPDTAGTQATKNDDDDQARVDGDTQAATDRIYRVQQNGEK